MGRLVLFDRVIDMAPDDIYLPAFLSLLFRLVWLIFLVFTLGAVIIDSCISTDTVGLFLIASTILLLVLIINEFILIKISMSGTISDPKPRENIGVFAHLHFVLVVLEVVVQAFGFYVIYDPIPVENLLKCTENAKIDISLTLVRIVIFWSFVSAFIYFVALSLFVWGSKAKNMVNKDWNDYLKLWKRRIEWFFTKETHRDHSETQAVIVSISQSLAKYFKDVDWAPTDMAVGLILLKQEQKIVRDVTELRNAGLNDDHDWSNWYQHESLNRNQVHRRKSQIEPDVDPQPSVIKGNHVDHSIKMQTFSFNVLEGEDSSDQSGSPKEHHPSQRLSLSHLPSVATLQEYANKVTQNIVGSHEESSLMVNTDLHKGKESQSNQLYNSPVHESKQSQSSLATLLDPPNSAPETVEMRPLTLNKKPRPTSAFYSSSVDRVKSLNKSKSYAVGSEDVIANANVVENFQLEYYEKQRQKLDWTFNSYAFSVPNQSKIEMKRPDILDVIHFCHYANMAYVQLDNEVQSKMDVLIHFSPLNDLFQSPYLVSLDHDWNSIVIAIRGTYSAADVIVDLKLDPEILDEDLPDPESYQVHSGFLRTAKNIVADILSNHILENIMGNRDSRVSKYSIVVCGHSLGGGVAAFVAYMLRKHGYMQTRCYAYAMPGGCTSEKASGLFNDFCISIVGGDDVVSRTTVRSLEILKADVGRLLNHSNQAKYQIFGSILSNQLKTKPVDPEVRIRKYSVSNTEYDRIRATTLSIPKRWKVNETSHAYLEPVFESETSPMFIPGRILYIEKLKDITQKYKSNPDIIPTDPEPIKRKRGQKSLQAFTDVVKERIVYVTHISVDSKYIYLPRWATKEEFQEVVVSRTMISDHTAIFGILKEYEDIHPDLPLKVYS